MKFQIIDESMFKPISSLIYIEKISNFLEEKLFYKTPPCCGESLKYWSNDYLNEKDLDKLEKMVDQLGSKKIKIECLEYFLDIYGVLNYFFQETVLRKNSKKKIDKKYYKIGSKLMSILNVNFLPKLI